jgi:predicted naringenin-chalcone synthase
MSLVPIKDLPGALAEARCEGMGEVHLLGLGTALPPHMVGTTQVAHFLSQIAFAQGAPASFGTKVERLVRASGVEHRYTVLADYQATDPADFKFFPKSWDLSPMPSTGARMALYQAEVVPLAEAAARRALADAKIDPKRVTHLIVTSCTGFFAPGPDVALIERLGLSPDVERTIVGFMGCYAGITGLRSAERIVRAYPDAVVLEVAVELSSIHVQRTLELRAALPNLLFGDGAGAAVFAGHGPSLGRVLGGASRVVPEYQASMTWTIGDDGFVMHLDAEVPEAIEAATLPFVAALLERHGLSKDGVKGWAIHPGGRRIVTAAGEALGLNEADLVPSLQTLRDIGNVSSATIFFVLERMRARRGPVLALAFGPGLTLEGALLHLG